MFLINFKLLIHVPFRLPQECIAKSNDSIFTHLFLSKFTVVKILRINGFWVVLRKYIFLIVSFSEYAFNSFNMWLFCNTYKGIPLKNNCKIIKYLNYKISLWVKYKWTWAYVLNCEFILIHLNASFLSKISNTEVTWVKFPQSIIWLFVLSTWHIIKLVSSQIVHPSMYG